jgi:hypothetical protein
MRGFLFGASLSIAFIVGCVARPFVVPAANAQQGAIAQKWEYFCFVEHGAEDVTEKANKAGRAGWELVAVASNASAKGNWCFKRAL